MAAEEKQDISTVLKKESCIYTACYCEENVWLLCNQIKRLHPESLKNFQVVFISNPSKVVPLWRQRASTKEDGFVLWDYHVILLHQDIMEYKVFDLDATLPFPTSFYEYSQKVIQSEEQFNEQYGRCFRVIPASVFLDVFASDRSHMLKEDKWIATPPSYPCISTQECSNNLQSFISMEAGKGYGDVMNCSQFVAKFTTDTTDGL